MSGEMKKMNRLLLVVPVAAGLVAGAAVSGLTRDAGHHHEVLRGTTAQEYAVGVITARVDGLEIYDVAESYKDYLPNQEFRRAGEAAAPFAEAFVSGEITSVNPGVGYSVAGKDAPTGEVTGFESPEARWRVVELEVTTDENTGATAGDSSVRIGLAIDGSTDYESFRNGLLGRTVAAPLAGQGFYAGAADLWNVARSDTMLGFVNADGTLAMPFLEVGWDLPETVGEIVDEAGEDRTVVEIGTEAGLPVQEP